MVDIKEGLNYPPGYAEKWIDAGLWTDERPYEWIKKWNDETPDALAIIGQRGELTYGEFYDRTLRCANGLLAAGIGKGDAIAMQLPNVPEILISWHALQMIGAIPVLLHMPYRAGELDPLMNHGGAKGVICWSGLANYDAPATFQGLRDTVPTLEHIFVVGAAAPKGTVAFETLLTAAADEISDPPGADDPCVLAFTSGTSSQPKAIVHSFRTFSSAHRLLAADCGIRQDDRVLSAPPFTHVYGMCVAGITLYAGGAVVLMEMFSPPAFAEAITDCQATGMFCAPAHYLGALHTGTLTPDVTAPLRFAVLAGAACPPEVFLQVEETFQNATAYQMFGMTEILMSFINPLDASHEVRLNSIGTAPDGHELRITDLDGNVLGPDEEGELEIRGAFLFSGYFHNDQATEECFREDGWFRSGDLATIDADGNVAMTGRIKDIINRGGIKINPIDIEALVDEHPDVHFSAIVPMADKIMGEKACLFVQLKPGAAMTLEGICAYLADNNMAKMKWPERLETIDAMPMTPTRKIVKGELVKELQARLVT